MFENGFHLFDNDFKQLCTYVPMEEYTFVYKNNPFVSHFSSNFLDLSLKIAFYLERYLRVFFLYFCNVNVNKIFEGISINTKLNKKTPY